MKEKFYSITELERKSGIPRRTIHFYSQEGIIPPPFGTGGAAKYGEIHLLRLRLIRILKKSHLKLSGIKEALDAMNETEMKRLLKTAEQDSSWENKSLGNWITSDDRGFGYLQMDMMSDKQYAEQDLFSVSEAPDFKQMSGPKSEEQNYLRGLKRKTDAKTRWERFSILDGVELSIRSDVDKTNKKLIYRLIEDIKDNIK
jgi:DNA-binding transcriptional MerR regulator